MPGIVIVGAGFGGIGMGIALKKAGYHDFVILDKAHDLGGTWRDNQYPGCACDVPSPLYSYSFELNPDWSRLFAPQREIWDYLRNCAGKHGLDEHIRFGTAVERMDWDDAARRWNVETVRDGELRNYRPHAVVSAAGALHLPSYPDIPGAAAFGGTSFHSARWDHSCDLAGQRVAVIGTGASAIQFVPQIAEQAAQLTVFQRTPPWIHPRPDVEIPARMRAAFRKAPVTARALRDTIYLAMEARAVGFTISPKLMAPLEQLAVRHLKSQVTDPALRARLTPDYTIGCKRILLSSDYYPALQRPNVSLVTDDITGITETGVSTADGTEHPADVIIYATGLQGGRVRHQPQRGRAGRAQARAGDPGGLPGRDRYRLPEPLPPPRSQHRPGAHLGGVHDREPDPARAELPAHPGPGQGGRDRGQRGGAAAVQRHAAAAAAPGGVERGRLRQLVPGRGRGEPDAVARLHVRVLGAHPPGAPRRLRGHRLMSAGPAVRSLGQVPATPFGPGVTATELLNDDHGCRGLHQRRLGFAGAARLAGTAGGRGEAWYVITGTGSVDTERTGSRPRAGDGRVAGTGAGYAARDGLEVLAVTLRAGSAVSGPARSVVRLEDCEPEITGDREFRVLLSEGLTLTQFAGMIPPGRAPAHHHTYDEVVHVLAGQGVVHLSGTETPIGPGTSIYLPPLAPHCLENTGPDTLRVLGVLHPAGSPAAKQAS